MNTPLHLHSYPSALQRAQLAAERILRSINVQRKVPVQKFTLRCVDASGSNAQQYVCSFYTKRGRKADERFLGSFMGDTAFLRDLAHPVLVIDARYRQYHTHRIFMLLKNEELTTKNLLLSVGVEEAQCVDVVDSVAHGLRYINAAVLPEYESLELEVSTWHPH